MDPMVTVNEGLQGHRGLSAGGHNTSRFWEKRGNIWGEMAKKGCSGTETKSGWAVKGLVFSVDNEGWLWGWDRLPQPWGLGVGRAAGAEHSKSPVSVPCRREQLTRALLHGYPSRIPLQRPLEGSGH